MGGCSMTTIMLAWVVWLPMLASAEAFGSVCPRWEDNPWCPCYSNENGIHLECPMVSLSTMANVLGLVKEPVRSLSIYDLDMNVTTLPAGIFQQSAGVSSLQISHSNVMSIADNSFLGLERSLESLTIKHCKLSAIPKVALHKLTNLSILDLQTNNITELPSFGFTKMNIKKLNFKGNMINLISDFAFDSLEESLEELNLINNDLKELPVNSLKKLKNIKKLEVAWNHITEFVTEDASFTTLEYFDLSSNRIRKIKSSSLVGMPGLVSLSLYMNSISAVARDAFKVNGKLETLFLGNNQIQELDPKTFRRTLNIRVIDLGNNNIHSVSNGVFGNLPELQELVLSRNNIREIMHQTFENSTSIRILNLEHNAIRFIDSQAFQKMTHLKTLLLSHNSIQEISPRLFTSNRNLKVLKLDHNVITDLDELTFKNATDLEELCLQRNKITKITRGLFSQSLELRELHLHDNEIKMIPAGVLSNLRNLSTLSLQNNGISTLLDILNHNSRSLWHFRLSGNKISSLHSEAFRGQTQLNFLWLDRNSIPAIVDGVFSDLTSVRELFLQENQIKHIHDDALSNMTSLQKLFLSDNHLDQIKERTFYGLSSMTELYLDGNMIKDISPNAFKWMTELEKLVLSGNELPSIKKEYFGTELPIKELSIDNAQITQIEDGALEPLIYLESLSLKGNNLHELHEGFLRLMQLYSLDLSSNGFQTLNVNSLTGLPNLETLDLSDCSIDVIPDQFFDSSISLKSLDISMNNIKQLKPAMLSGLSDLVSLDVSGNQLAVDSCKAFLSMRKLEHLSISNNSIISLCPALGQLKELRELYASNTLLLEAEMATFVKLRHLHILDISDNMIRDFPIGSFQSSSLRELNIASNGLTQVPNALFTDNMETLKVLNISGNPLQRIVGSVVDKSMSLEALERLDALHTNLTVITSLEFSHMPALRSLNLERGLISKVSPGAFRSLSQLSNLNLGYNLLEILPRERLRGLTSLSHLNLTRNRIKKFDQLPPDAQKLKVIDISGNMLTELEETTFKNSQGLEEILLSDNWITSIQPKTLEPLGYARILDFSQNFLETLRPAILAPVERTIEEFRLDGNPVTCGCESMELWTWLQNHPAQVKHPHAIKCDLPESLRGQSFLQLSASAFCPQPLILRLAIQDIQSQSFLVSWQAANSSAVFGFKVTYQSIDEDLEGEEERKRRLTEVRSSPTLGMSSRTYLLEGLQPSTEYQVCVHGLTRSIGLARSHTVEPVDSHLQGEGAKCSRGQTLSVPAAPATGTSGSRIGIILGIILAVALLLGVVIAVVWYRVCRSQRGRDQEPTKRPNGAPPPDYYSHFQGRHSHRDDDDEFAC